MQKLLNNRNCNNTVTRIISEIKYGRPVVIYNDNGKYLLVTASELLTESMLREIIQFDNKAYVLLAANRVNYLFQKSILTFTRIAIDNNVDISCIRKLLLGYKTHGDYNMVQYRSILDEYALKLIKLSKLLPSAVVVDLDFETEEDFNYWCKDSDILKINSSLIDEYEDNYQLNKLCDAPLILEECEKVKFIVYRPNNHDLDHYAIIIGNPDYSNPLVRIHSSCYTGDLLASLSCDCRNQLHAAIKIMANNGGGIILYLAQDGRGIGLANKIRTYSLQAHDGFDTVDANRFFGFEDDERNFFPAVSILRNLNVASLRLLTNNPSKARSLEEHGIEVKECVKLFTKCNKYNENYITTKLKRLGHVR